MLQEKLSYYTSASLQLLSSLFCVLCLPCLALSAQNSFLFFSRIFFLHHREWEPVRHYDDDDDDDDDAAAAAADDDDDTVITPNND